jgi:hypothetical protein
LGRWERKEGKWKEYTEGVKGAMPSGTFYLKDVSEFNTENSYELRISTWDDIVKIGRDGPTAKMGNRQIEKTVKRTNTENV